MKPKREWTPDEIAIMQSQQYTQQELADLFGCARMTISRAFKELGIAPRRSQRVPVSARVPTAILAAVDAKAKRRKINRNQAIVDALEAWAQH